jgi:hypothetical protein
MTGAFWKQFGNPEREPFRCTWVGNKKALSKTLGAKGHGGGPNSAQRSMLLNAVRSRRKPCINIANCKSLERGCLLNLAQYWIFYTRSPRSRPFPQLLPDLN